MSLCTNEAGIRCQRTAFERIQCVLMTQPAIVEESSLFNAFSENLIELLEASSLRKYVESKIRFPDDRRRVL